MAAQPPVIITCAIHTPSRRARATASGSSSSAMMSATSNAEQAVRARRLVEALGRSVATPGEARAMLGLKGKDQVAF